jgi:4-hydroxybenzoate polyprenyltransferase
MEMRASTSLPADGRGPVTHAPTTAERGRAAPGVAQFARDAFVTARPAQWAKNLLVFAAFIFSAGTAWSWREPSQWLPLLRLSIATFVVFDLIASGAYFVNDAIDADQDRLHPRKRTRPIAAGRISPWTGAGIGMTLMLAGVLVAALLDMNLGLVALGYAALTLWYSVALKRVVVLDVLVVSAGFAIRAIAGAVAIDVPISPWLYVVTTLGALFLAVVRRRQEMLLFGDDASAHRSVLQEYTLHALDQMVAVAMSATIVAYTLYVTTAENLPSDHSMLLTLPIVLYAVFRFYLIAERSPDRNVDELLVSDPAIAVAIAGFGLTALAVLALHR